ncbi:MAG TPA: M14 family metallopeptidase [Vicinamibacterales bacterium]|nr:M14 family metallopeptidase [Vicinamibacterales bacterium]
MLRPTRFLLLAALLPLGAPAPAGAQPRTPEQFFGFRIGTDGELARYPQVLEYMRHLAATTERVRYEELGKTTMGHPYVLVTISAPQNLARLTRLVEITRRLADPRRTTPAEAAALAEEGRPFYLLFTTIHSTEVGNMQGIIEIAHRLATDQGPAVREILDNVVLLLVPSQNPDGQVLVIDHWYRTKGTPLARVYPDLYHKYAGHDDNRDWFMFTQRETRLAVQLQNRYKPQLTHDMHQMGPTGARIFVPPYEDPYDPNVHPIIAQEQTAIGQAMATALVAEGKEGVSFASQYDLWTPARQYMVYHGQPRILTEIASANLADPFVNPEGADRPLGPQERRWNFPLPYSRGEWRLRQIVDYGVTAVFAGLTHMAKYRRTWLENFYRVHADWVRRTAPPYAFVIPAGQRDPYAVRELLDILRFAEVEIHQARAPFTAGGRRYAEGSYVVKLAQPYGAFAKTMLERQVYPDLRLFPGGPPKPPYDVTGHTLGMLLGVDVDQIDQPFEADLADVTRAELRSAALPPRPGWAYAIGPESNAAFFAVAGLQKAGVPVSRAAARFEAGGRTFAPGTWIVPVSPAATRVLETVVRERGLEIHGVDRAVDVQLHRLKPATRIGLWKIPNNMPAGWLMWLFEHFGFDYRIVSAADVQGDLAAKYDVLVLPSGTTREAMVRGLDPARYDREWSWAYGIGEAGWAKLREWVMRGGTLVAIGSAVETARELLDLPIEKALPEAPRRRRAGAAGPAAEAPVPASEVDRVLREAFSSPARLAAVLRERVIDPASLFYCPGSLLENEFDPSHPVAYGMPPSWPVFFESDQAYRLAPGFGIQAEVVSRYPATGPILRSGWLLGEAYLRNLANTMAFRVGRGYVVAFASQIDFRTQPRATIKMLFNAILHGPATTGQGTN